MDQADWGLSSQMMDTFGALVPLLDKNLRLTPNPRRPKARRLEETDDPSDDVEMHPRQAMPLLQIVQTMAQLVIRQDQEMQSLRKMDQFILFLNQEPSGALDVLLKATQVWKQQMESQSKSQMMSLRQHLMIALLKAMRHCLDQIMQCQDSDELYKTSLAKGLILADRSFPYHRWDPVAKKLTIDKKPAIAGPKLAQHLDELSEMMLDSELVIRFHALRSPTEKEAKIIPWRLQINLRSDRPYELIYQLAHNSIWMAIGAAMKPHSLGQSPLAHNLQNLLGNQRRKGEGKGKGKQKSKHAQK